MQKHELKRTHKNKKTRRVGRGGKHAKTSGRGTKGQNARAGHKKRPEIRDFIKRLPKMRGRGKNLNTSIQTKAEAVSLRDISKTFKAGAVVSPVELAKLGLVSSPASRVKILATGEIDKKVTISGCQVSASAKLAIEKAGGSIAISK